MVIENLDYIFVFVFLVFSVGISKLILGLHYYAIPQFISLDKVLGYECGYDPFGDARSAIDVQFYLVGILFLIFDLEIAFIFPWGISLSMLGLFGLFLGYIFLIFLSIGFIFEYKKGALYW